MKQHWTPQELIDHWTLTAEEMALVGNVSQTDYNQLGYALMFKCFGSSPSLRPMSGPDNAPAERRTACLCLCLFPARLVQQCHAEVHA
jgi:hypothetical protein